MKVIYYYLRIYQKFVETCIAQVISFRTNFFLLILLDFVFCLVNLASVDFIYGHVENIGIWNRNQFMFFTSFMIIINNLQMGFVSSNFWEFPYMLRTGQYDFVLLRPASPIFSTFFRYIKPSSFISLIIPASFLIYFGNLINLSFTDWLFIPPLIILSFLTMIIYEFIICSLMFWMVEGYGINFLRMQFQQASRWPDFVYSFWVKKFLTFVIPVLLVFSAPVHFIIGGQVSYLLYLVVAIIAGAIIFKLIWNTGIRQYESASS